MDTSTGVGVDVATEGEGSVFLSGTFATLGAATAPGLVETDSATTEPAPRTTARHIAMTRCRRDQETVRR